ncbi:MAG: DUF3108 domain-containing protein [Gemmatimonadetes bacterium]|nr:DUF3108 domain-containing protein [Gemmatimonadota bacterium]
MTRGLALVAALAASALGSAPAELAAQDSTALAAPASAQAPPRPRTPWATGEFLEYNLKFGVIKAGSGRMQVLGRDTVRGRDTWHLKFDFSGGVWMARVEDVFESWLDAETHNSLRFEQHLSELGKKRDRVYKIFPDRGVFQLNDEAEKPSVFNPLDDTSFFYFIRTIPLEVGKSYEFHRYFDPKANPVSIRVLRKEQIEVPAGKFDAIVIQPMIKTNGIFAEGGHAELWLSDDDRRILLQMKSKLPFGSLNLYLRKVTLPPLVPDSSGALSR